MKEWKRGKTITIKLVQKTIMIQKVIQKSSRQIKRDKFWQYQYYFLPTLEVRTCEYPYALSSYYVNYMTLVSQSKYQSCANQE